MINTQKSKYISIQKNILPTQPHPNSPASFAQDPNFWQKIRRCRETAFI